MRKPPPKLKKKRRVSKEEEKEIKKAIKVRDYPDKKTHKVSSEIGC